MVSSLVTLKEVYRLLIPPIRLALIATRLALIGADFMRADLMGTDLIGERIGLDLIGLDFIGADLMARITLILMR